MKCSCGGMLFCCAKSNILRFGSKVRFGPSEVNTFFCKGVEELSPVLMIYLEENVMWTNFTFYSVNMDSDGAHYFGKF